MGFIARSQLASAVSNAGGLGIIETSSGDLDAVRSEIRRMRELTGKPFGVNIAQAFVRDPGIEHWAIAWRYIEAISLEDDNARAGVAVWFAVGALSTVSHGYFAAFSFPTWVVFGAPSIAAAGPREAAKLAGPQGRQRSGVGGRARGIGRVDRLVDGDVDDERRHDHAGHAREADRGSDERHAGELVVKRSVEELLLEALAFRDVAGDG